MMEGHMGMDGHQQQPHQHHQMSQGQYPAQQPMLYKQSHSYGHPPGGY